jgi:hypothetical protein
MIFEIIYESRDLVCEQDGSRTAGIIIMERNQERDEYMPCIITLSSSSSIKTYYSLVAFDFRVRCGHQVSRLRGWSMGTTQRRGNGWDDWRYYNDSAIEGTGDRGVYLDRGCGCYSVRIWRRWGLYLCIMIRWYILQNKICIPCIIGLVRILLYQMYIPSPAFRFRRFVSSSGR